MADNILDNEDTSNPQTRSKRTTQKRSEAVREQTWRPPELLPSPEQEHGYKFRWIRTSTLGSTDAVNISSKTREGWTPVKASDYPQIVSSEGEGRFKDNVVIGGLVLCKMPTEMVEQRNEHYTQKTRQQMESVDNNYMRENDPRMPMFKERKTKVSFGSGT